MTGLDEGLSLRMTQAVTIITAVIIVAAMFWFLNHTRTGKSMRAYSDNENLALLSGINPDRVVMITWILVAALATIAGTLYGLDKSFKPFVYMQLLLPIFASAIVGGVGNPVGAIAGGYVPIKLIHVIVPTPPSVRLERRYRQAIINSYFENGWGVPFTFCSFHGGFNLRRSVQMVKPPWQIFSDVL